jgi:hypothetical protein
VVSFLIRARTLLKQYVLGHLGPLKKRYYWRTFREKLREAMGSFSWVGAEAAGLHEIVYETVWVECSYEWTSETPLVKPEDWGGLFTIVQHKCV